MTLVSNIKKNPLMYFAIIMIILCAYLKFVRSEGAEGDDIVGGSILVQGPAPVSNVASTATQGGGGPTPVSNVAGVITLDQYGSLDPEEVGAFTVHKNKFIQGNKMGARKYKSLNYCMNACAEDPDCRGFDYKNTIKDSKKWCQLKGYNTLKNTKENAKRTTYLKNI